MDKRSHPAVVSACSPRNLAYPYDKGFPDKKRDLPQFRYRYRREPAPLRDDRDSFFALWAFSYPIPMERRGLESDANCHAKRRISLILPAITGPRYRDPCRFCVRGYRLFRVPRDRGPRPFLGVSPPTMPSSFANKRTSVSSKMSQECLPLPTLIANP